jgi:hypothetical protein
MEISKPSKSWRQKIITGASNVEIVNDSDSDELEISDDENNGELIHLPSSMSNEKDKMIPPPEQDP